MEEDRVGFTILLDIAYDRVGVFVLIAPVEEERVYTLEFETATGKHFFEVTFASVVGFESVMNGATIQERS